jgi:hypothetical protein
VSQDPPWIRTLNSQDQKRSADLSDWFLRSEEDLALFLVRGLNSDPSAYDEFDSVDEIQEFVIGTGRYSDGGLFFDEDDAWRLMAEDQRYRCPECVREGIDDPYLEFDYSEDRRESHQLDAEERVVEEMEVYCGEHDGFSVSYRSVSHE